MEENKDHNRRKSVFESLPSYLAGFAAVATAAVAVLSYLHNRDVETTARTEPEVSRQHVGAVPSLEVAPARSTSGNAPTKATPVSSTAQTKPTLDSALHPTRCPAYIGTWKLSTGELMSVFDNERVEVRASAGSAPRFGRWACNGRSDEVFYLTLDRGQQLVFDASGDGTQIYQRTDQRTATPLSATRTAP